MKKNWKNRFSQGCFHALYALAKRVYPTPRFCGLENLPDEPCIIVGNHAQIHGPAVSELFLPGERAIWCNYQVMDIKEAPAYAYADFWGQKPRCIRWFFKGLSYVIAPLLVFVLKRAHTIAVYRDARLLTTFRNTFSALQKGANVVIFPECYTPYNGIVYTFQDKFIDVARFYHRRTGNVLSFVPMYIAPALHQVCFGKPIRFRTDAPIEEERARIATYLMDEITNLALALPPHRVVPYPNVSSREYPMNVISKDAIKP